MIEHTPSKNRDLVQRDIVAAINSPKANLTLNSDIYYYDDGTLVESLCLSGTVASYHKEHRYNIPIEIWFHQDHPEVPPLAFVRPTAYMIISTTNKYVLPNGKLIIPYLKHWDPSNSNLTGLLNEMSKNFGVFPPVFAKSSTASNPTSHLKNSSSHTSLSVKPYSSLAAASESHINSLPSISNASTSVTYGLPLGAASSHISEQNQHSHRFFDIATEPLKILLPIQGYEYMPLVSLKEAIIPLVSLVEDVEQMVWFAKQRCTSPKDGLTSDESASTRDILKPWFLYLRLVINALQKVPTNYRTVYRGVNGNLSADYRRGETIIWWGFSSCTRSIETLNNEQFWGKTGSRTFFSIECESGKSIRSHSFYEDEDEILLLPARQFEVLGCLDQGNGLQIVQLKETQPKFPLLKLPSS